MSKEALMQRLDEITQAAIESGYALAVLGLGSAGMEQERMDEYSDLDVWIIVEDGFKEGLVDDLNWLTKTCPIGYKFKHSSSGYGLLFEDGIFSELDIFEVGDLATMNFEGARIIWKAAGVPDTIPLSQQQSTPTAERALEAMLGEALGNLYIGLGRFYRGEKLTAMRFIQVYAVDQILRVAHLLEEEKSVRRDPFSNDRRFEARFPGIGSEIASFTQGYDRTPESALAILEFLDEHFEVNPAIKQAILGRLAERNAN